MTEEKIEMWAIVELFGHQWIAGKITEAEIGGCSFVRVDVPEVDGSQAITKFYGNGAIYSATLVSEELVRAYIKKHKPAPLNVYMPEIKQISLQATKSEDIEEGTW